MDNLGALSLNGQLQKCVRFSFGKLLIKYIFALNTNDGMKLKQISRILVQFSPWTGEARSAREFLARVTSAPARASNPDCKVEHRVM